jgi:FtsP/CotA-like multicopper oxidase with cupredoxin domain
MISHYGTVALVNGEQRPSFAVPPGEVVRLYLTNTATTRVFNLAITGGAALRRLGGDSGRGEREVSGNTVMLAPSESVIVDVLFDSPGDAVLQHRTSDQAQPLSTFTVGANPAGTSVADADRQLRAELQHR